MTDFISLNNITYSYPDSPECLFDNLSVQFKKGWTVISGNNGCGKSTLLKILTGEINPDEGFISLGNNHSVEYCPQSTVAEPDNLIQAFYDEDNNIKRLFSRMNISEEMIYRYDSLSGGEKKKIQIACTLAKEPQVLLLDEPTNHIDVETKELIAECLSDFNGIGIIVSHDRNFADLICTYTLFMYKDSDYRLNGENTVKFDMHNASLSKALAERKEKDKSLLDNWNKIDAKARYEKTIVQKDKEEVDGIMKRLTKNYTQPVNKLAILTNRDRVSCDKKRNAQQKLDRTIQKRDSSIKPLNRKQGFSMMQEDFHCQYLVEEGIIMLDNYTLQYPSLQINDGDRINLCGANGSGKTLMIKRMLEYFKEHDKIKNVLYIPQELSSVQQKKLLMELNLLEDQEKAEVISTLYRLGSKSQTFTCCTADSELSPGELKKLMIALNIKKQVNLLIMDEPTNHMDIGSIESFEQALKEISCSLLLVSHDKSFSQALTNKEWKINRHGNKGLLCVL